MCTMVYVHTILRDSRHRFKMGSLRAYAQTSMLHIRVEDDIKEQATQALTAMGLSVSDAGRLFLRRVVIDRKRLGIPY